MNIDRKRGWWVIGQRLYYLKSRNKFFMKFNKINVLKKLIDHCDWFASAEKKNKLLKLTKWVYMSASHVNYYL